MDLGGGSVDYDKLRQALLASLEPLKDLRLDLSRVETGRKIGSGGFSDVFLATLKTRVSWYKSVKTPVVVKKLKVDGDTDQRLRVVAALARELVVWSRFKHPNVLGLLGYYFDGLGYTYACAVTELQENGNIMEYVRRTNPSQDRRLELVHDVASGLAYLHSLEPPVCHGDIKPENTLVNQLHRAVICDFGLAKTLNTDPSGLTTTSQPFTPRYASPEVLQDASSRTLPSDVWSWGCLVYQLMSDRSPYSDMPLGAIYAAATSGLPPATLDGLSSPPDLKTLLISCWAFEDESRPSMRNCKRAVSKLKPHYPAMSDYFYGVALNVDVNELPGDRKDGLHVLYNPDLDRILEIMTSSTIYVPRDLSLTVVSANGENAVICDELKIRTYNVLTMTRNKRRAIPKAVLLSKVMVHPCCSRGADLVAFSFFERVYISNFSDVHAMSMASPVSSISFADQDRLLIVGTVGGALEAFRIGDKRSAVAKVWARQTERYNRVEAMSSRFPVGVAGPAHLDVGEDLFLINVRTGNILQEFRNVNNATFSPDGLGVLLHGTEVARPSFWQFSSPSEVDSTCPSFLLSPTGPRGRFIEVGTIQGPNQRVILHMAVSSDNLLACGVYRERWQMMVQVWSLVTRKTLLVLVPPGSESWRYRWTVFFRTGSTAAGGYIDVFCPHCGPNIGHAIKYVATGVKIENADLSI